MELSYTSPQDSFQNIKHSKLMTQQYTSKGLYGFTTKSVPFFGATIAFFTILATYFVARNKNPPGVDHFPKTDITRIAIHFPEYIIFRIGLLVVPVLFCISFLILKNYLEVKSFQIKGKHETRIKHFGLLSIISSILLCISTGTISDARDMDWELHYYTAIGSFAIALYILIISSKIYRELHQIKHFCASWSYRIKRYNNKVIVALLLMQLFSILKWIDVGYLAEWSLTFYIILFVFSLSSDFKNFEIMLIRKK